MSTSRIALAAFFTLAWAGVGKVHAQNQTTATTTTDEESASCWECDDFTTTDGFDKHYDYLPFYGPFHGGGGMHWSSSVYGHCADAHVGYNTSPEAQAGAVSLLRLASSGDMSHVMDLLLTNESVVLNVDRSAVQVIAESNHSVLVHIPISRSETDRLGKALAQAREERSSGTAPKVLTR